MPSVYNHRHVELDKVGRGKRVIQPPGGQTADIFGRSTHDQAYSSASSQAGSDVASSRVHIETDQQSVGSAANSAVVDGVLIKQQQQQQQQAAGSNGQMSPTGSLGSSSVASMGITGSSSASVVGQQQLLMADDFGPTPAQLDGLQQQQQQRPMTVHSGCQDVSRTPKKTIPVLRRNPITGEVIENPVAQPAVVRVRQPPGGRSSGIF